ncbi:hypothetical protein SNK03_005665 [Fusarium graminearum]
MAMPQRGGNNNNNGNAQQARVEDLRNKGLTCNDRGDGIFVCDDGLGGNCFKLKQTLGVNDGGISRSCIEYLQIHVGQIKTTDAYPSRDISHSSEETNVICEY